MFKRILTIGCIHSPFYHPQMLDFLKCVKKDYKPDKVVLLGDEIDNHAISFHDSDPDLFCASQELELAIDKLTPLYELFPRAAIMESNHTSLFYRRQKHHGLPRAIFKEYREILKAPKTWLWYPELILKTKMGDTYFHHGLSSNALRVSQTKSMNYVAAHYHSKFSIQYWLRKDSAPTYAMQVGCLIDYNSLAFDYGKNNLAKPLLGCAVIIDGVPELIPLC